MSATPLRIIPGRTRALTEDLQVRRVLPHHQQRMVGPFIFLDEMGPADFDPGTGMDVPPHPHIGLATVTYLFEGAITHRDSLGVVQEIRPGDLNWMTAGRGIVHSERTPDRERTQGQRLHGLQIWCALPLDKEEMQPTFQHVPERDLPTWEDDAVHVRLIAGTAGNRRSPVRVESDLFYVHVHLPAQTNWQFQAEQRECAVYVVSGSVRSNDQTIQKGELTIFGRDDADPTDANTMLVERIDLTTEGSPAQLVCLGGAALSGRRKIWWNFVASDTERLERAKDDWRNRRFPAVPGDDGYIPLPDS